MKPRGDFCSKCQHVVDVPEIAPYSCALREQEILSDWQRLMSKTPDKAFFSHRTFKVPQTCPYLLEMTLTPRRKKVK